MELELGLALPTTKLMMNGLDLNHDAPRSREKRSFDTAFVDEDGDDDGDNGCNHQDLHGFDK